MINRLLTAVLILQIVIGLSYTVLTPLWQGHEQDYYTVVRFLVTQHRLPTPADYPNGDAEIRQATQPPLYFLMAAPIVALFDNGQPIPYGVQPSPLCLGNPNSLPVLQYVTNQAYNDPFQGTLAAAYALRIVNVLLGALAVFFTYKAGRVLFPDRPVFALVGAALLAFEPASLQFIPALGNDTLLLTVCAAILWMSARVVTESAVSWRDVLILIALSIAAPLIKLPGWVALPLVILVIGVRLVARSRGSRILLLSLGLIAVLTVVIGLFNVQHYGSVLGRYSVLDASFLTFTQKLNLPPVIISGLIDETRLEFIGPLASLHPRAAFVTAYNLLLLVCVMGMAIGLVWALIKRSQRRAYGLLLALLAITCVIVLLRNTLIANADNTTVYNLAMIFAPVRYYNPGLPALALLVAAGLGSILPRFSRGLLGAIPALAFALISLGVMLMLFVNRPPEPLIDPAAVAAIPGVHLVNLQPAPDAPKVIAYRLQPEAGQLDLTLYSTLDKTTEVNYMAQAELMGGQPHPLCEFLPAHGVYPTPRWSAGEVVQTEQMIPNCGADLPPETPLTLRWVGYSLDGTVVETTPTVTLAQIDQPLGKAASCPADLGVIDGRYQLVKWNSPAEIQAGDVYLPSAIWFVVDLSPVPLRRVFRFVQSASGQEYTCIGSPSEGSTPVQSWIRGQFVYFDECQMRFPADAPSGLYQVSVGMQADGGQMLSAVGIDGQTTTWLPAGQIEVSSPHA